MLDFSSSSLKCFPSFQIFIGELFAQDLLLTFFCCWNLSLLPVCWMVISLAYFLSSFGRSWVYSIIFMKWKMLSRIFSDFHFYLISALSWHCLVCKSCPFEDQEQLMCGGFGSGCRYLSAQQLEFVTQAYFWGGQVEPPLQLTESIW